jgi:hypothetical protein
MWYTENAGGRWFPRASRYAIADLAVESIDTAYVAVAGGGVGDVSKSTNKGFTWGDAKDANLAGTATCYSITVLAKDKVIVGSADGYVSYTTDGNANWTKISTQLSGGAAAVLATATTLDSGDYIYAGTAANSTVERWQIGTSTSWKNLNAPVLGGYRTVGMSLNGGVLYQLVSDGVTDSRVQVSRNPTDNAPSWSTSNIGAGRLTLILPVALRISTESLGVVLWVVDSVTSDTYSFTNSVSSAVPALSGPATDAIIKVNPISGATYNVSLSWKRPHSATSVATDYDVRIALDSGFNEVVVTNLWTALSGAAATTAENVAVVQGGGLLMPDTKYYWRIRVAANAPLQSAWSETRSFTIQEAKVTPPVNITTAPAPTFTIPAIVPTITMPAPVITMPAPPAATTITIPPAPAPQQVSPSYIWAIVIIGAVLVIAVIVLIVRTRRPV